MLGKAVGRTDGTALGATLGTNEGFPEGFDVVDGDSLGPELGFTLVDGIDEG